MYSEIISSSSPLFDAVASASTQAVGDYFHKLFLLSIEDGDVHPNTFYLLTPNKLSAIPILGETTEARYEKAIQAGRDFANEFGVQAIHFLVHQALCWEGTGDTNVRPTDDPARIETAYTFVAPLLDLCLAPNITEYLSVLHQWNLRVWCNELHEGLSVRVRDEHSLVVTTINKELGHYDKNEENIFVVDNMLFNQCIVGLSPSFPAIHNLNDVTPLNRAITLELLSKKADALNKEIYADP
jgi:hypothetical protein